MEIENCSNCRYHELKGHRTPCNSCRKLPRPDNWEEVS